MFVTNDSGGGSYTSDVELSAYWGCTVSGGTVATNDYFDTIFGQASIGTLTTATPTSFVSTGYNQYNATAGYAHVKGSNQYRVSGTYTSLGFTTEVGGTTSAVTVTSGKFTPSEDGYIYVNGASGDILIALVWSGIRDTDPFEAYETSTVAIPTVDASNNPLPTATYGIPSVNTVRDELNFDEKKYYQRVGHYAYSAENLATVQALGVDYWYDESDIFYVLETPVVYTLADSVSGEYEANDFGTEEFVGTTVAPLTDVFYMDNLVDKLRNLADIQTIGSGLTLTDGELTAAGGGSGSAYTVYSTKTTSNSNRGGAIYLGTLNSSQIQNADPTTNDLHRKYFYALPYSSSAIPASNSIFIGAEQTSNFYSGMIGLGFGATCEASYVINIGGQYGRGEGSVVIGSSAKSASDGQSQVVIGQFAGSLISGGNGSISLGAYSRATRNGEMNIGSENYSFGYNNTNYRLISGVHNGEDLHDAATVAQGNQLATSAPTSTTPGALGGLYTDTSAMHTYQLTAIDETDPDNPVYSWTMRW